MQAPQRRVPAAAIARWAFATAAVASCMFGQAATASDFSGTATQSVQANAAKPQVDFSVQSVPRFDNVDGSSRTDRLDLAVAPASSPLALTFGVSNAAPAPAGFAPGPSGSNVDLGMRWRHHADAGRTFDFSAYRRVSPTPQDALGLIQSHDPTYGARVELGLSAPSRQGFVADRGLLGLQLESGARIAIRRYARGPMLYYRNDF